ncbi:MAG: hypothetical protein QME06_05035 [Desulfobacterales bacterium]|nr:hypothetical protein [Desulfobacterales bacterium]
MRSGCRIKSGMTISRLFTRSSMLFQYVMEENELAVFESGKELARMVSCDYY